MKVGLTELIEAFERSTSMKRAPVGVRSKGLREPMFSTSQMLTPSEILELRQDLKEASALAKELLRENPI